MRKLIVLTTILANTVYAGNLTAIAKSEALRTDGQSRNAIPAVCNHAVEIKNPTGNNEYPTVYYTICMEGEDCQTTKFKQKVNNGTFKHCKQNVMYHTYRYAGHYKLHCETQVDNIAVHRSDNEIVVY